MRARPNVRLLWRRVRLCCAQRLMLLEELFGPRPWSWKRIRRRCRGGCVACQWALVGAPLGVVFCMSRQHDGITDDAVLGGGGGAAVVGCQQPGRNRLVQPGLRGDDVSIR